MIPEIVDRIEINVHQDVIQSPWGLQHGPKIIEVKVYREERMIYHAMAKNIEVAEPQ